jgi:hypothetical protein
LNDCQLQYDTAPYGDTFAIVSADYSEKDIINAKETAKDELLREIEDFERFAGDYLGDNDDFNQNEIINFINEL